MEAGGVEPPSEKARNEENYVRSRLSIFGRCLRTGKNNNGLVRLIFIRKAPDRNPLAYPAR